MVVSATVRSKATEFASLVGGIGNLENLHLASLTRVVFQVKDTSKVKAEELATKGFNLMNLGQGKFHLVCALDEAAAMNQALLEAQK